MGVLIVLRIFENHRILLLLIFLAFPMDSQVISSWFMFDCASTVSLTLHFLHNQFSHLQIVLHSFTSYRNPPMGPPPSTRSPRNLRPHRPSHLALGHPFLYLYTHPKLFFIHLVIVKNLCLQHLHSFLLSPLATFFSWKRNPCHPWLGHSLSSTPVDIIHKPRVSHSPCTPDL
jgi:hypothetical protein